ncbi:MAG: hypothetical protein LLF90_09220 [Methanomicrobiaceae archaeon]|uniref:hypothetical protein n=1 Tax=Methanoculleus sp. TaxID=90427 RepID=UPI00320C1463|nr:hypothetical protein [Methanomicrobiaceae archaeon]
MRRIGVCGAAVYAVGMLLVAAACAGGYPGIADARDTGMIEPQAEQSAAGSGTVTLPDAGPTANSYSNGTTVVYFPAGRIGDLRNATQNANVGFDSDYGGSSTEIKYLNNLTAALDPYDHIGLREGYKIEGYWVSDYLQASIIPFVVEENVTALPMANRTQLLPEEADENISRYLEGDDSPESYLEASVFLRELYAIGAWWHARIGWPQQTVLESPEMPSVAINSTHATVTIYTEELYCGYRTVARYTDTYSRMNYEVSTTEWTTISQEADQRWPCY